MNISRCGIAVLKDIFSGKEVSPSLPIVKSLARIGMVNFGTDLKMNDEDEMIYTQETVYATYLGKRAIAHDDPLFYVRVLIRRYFKRLFKYPH
jgi:hypothetical protein